MSTKTLKHFNYNIHSRLVAFPRQQRKDILSRVMAKHLISRTTWFRYINEYSEIPAPVLRTLATELGCQMEELFN